MPILEHVAAEEPLSQGDVLKGVRLHITANSWNENGGESSHLQKHNYCLVISRPCVIAHKPNILVALIDKYKIGKPNDCESFRDMLDFLAEMRDGRETPDMFYIGQLPGEEGRYCARLDSIHTVQLPSPEDESRRHFVHSRRVARLHSSFIKDLHNRIFISMAYLGFSDHQWFSTPDLSSAVALGELELRQAETEHQQHQAKLAGGIAQGFTHDTQRSKLERQIRDSEEKARKIRESLAPFKKELDARNNGDLLS